MAKLVLIEEEFLVRVDFDRPIEALVEAGGYRDPNKGWIARFAQIDSENFPAIKDRPSGVERLKFFRVDARTTYDEALEEMAAAGRVPSLFPEVLAFGREHPELQSDCMIVGLGSLSVYPSGYQQASCLSYAGGRRGLHLMRAKTTFLPSWKLYLLSSEKKA